MMLGGAMAGLYGMIEITAIQGRLRGGIGGGYGYIGFLVAWLAGQRPIGIIVMAALLAILSVGGDAIQLAGLPSSTTNILTALIRRPYVSQNITGLNAVPIPLLSSLPFVGPVVFNHDLLTYFGYLIGPLIWLFLYRTRWGLSLRAVGESTAVAFSTGRNPARIQYAAVFFGGMMAGLGGAQP